MADDGSAIPLGINTTPQDYLGTAGKAMALQGQMNQNRLFQQQYNTNLAVGKAYKEAVDPATGQVDQAKLVNSLANDPTAAYSIPTVMSQQQEFQNKQFELAQKHITNMSNQISSLMATPAGQLTPKTVISAMGDMVSQKMLTPQEMATELASMPQDEGGIRQWLQQHALRYADTATKLNAVYGTPTAYNTGGQTNIVSTPTGGGAPILRGTIQNTMSPDTASTPQEVVDPNSGARGAITRGEFAASRGVPGATGAPVTTGIAGAPGAPAGANPGGQGGGPQAVSPTPTALGPGRQNYLQGAGTHMADFENDLTQRVQSGAALSQRLSESLDALKQFKPGAQAPVRAAVAEFAQKLGAPQGLVDKIAQGDLGAMQEFNKLAVQQSTEALKQALGSNRIALIEFNTFQKANPNLGSDPRAIEKMYNFVTRVYQRDAAEQKAFNDYRQSGQDILNFPAYWQQESQRQGWINPKGVVDSTGGQKTGPGSTGHKKSLTEIFGGSQ